RGFFQQEIADAAFANQREIDEQHRIIVGVNDFVDEGAKVEIPILQMDPKGFERQVARLAKLRQERDNEKVGSALASLRQAAQGTENVMPCLLEAVKTYATLQEIMDVLRGVFGEYRESSII